MSVEQLIKELEKHLKGANVLVCLRLSENYKLSAEDVSYKPTTNQVVIYGGK